MKPRHIRIEGDVAYIPLTQGYEAIIDAEDVPLVEGYNWHARIHSNTVYARRGVTENGRQSMLNLHRAIMEAEPGTAVTHLNGDGLDNRKCNLVGYVRTRKPFNKRIRSRNKSGYRGVSWDKIARKWKTTITVDGRTKHVGYFKAARDAHRAYLQARAYWHGK